MTFLIALCISILVESVGNPEIKMYSECTREGRHKFVYVITVRPRTSVQNTRNDSTHRRWNFLIMNGWHARAEEVALGIITDTNHVCNGITLFYARQVCALFTPATAKPPRGHRESVRAKGPRVRTPRSPRWTVVRPFFTR